MFMASKQRNDKPQFKHVKGKQTINIEQGLIYIKEELKTSEISKENKVETWIRVFGQW